jgi:hypothetical protein
VSGAPRGGIAGGAAGAASRAGVAAAAANIVANARSKSVSVMMPTTRVFSVTGRAPIRWASTSRTASAIGASGPIVMTDRVMTRSTSNRSRR